MLYPPSLRDLLLTLAALGAYDVIWSETILAEVERNVLADHPDIDAARFRRHTLGAMRAAFPSALVAPTGDAALDAPGVYPGDRHVIEAALAGGADAIVTINVRHFPQTSLCPAGLSVMTPGALVRALDEDEQSLIDLALGAMASRWKNPPRTADEILDLLAVHPTMAEPAHRIKRRRAGGLERAFVAVAEVSPARGRVVMGCRGDVGGGGCVRAMRSIHARRGCVRGRCRRRLLRRTTGVNRIASFERPPPADQ